MSEKSERKEERKPEARFRSHDAEEVSEILAVVSEKIPSLLKGLIDSVFSPESAANMGKAAAAYYKELIAAGMPDDVAVKMTQDYVGTFTKFGDFMKNIGERSSKEGAHKDIEDEIRRAVLIKMKRKFGEEEEDKDRESKED